MHVVKLSFMMNVSYSIADHMTQTGHRIKWDHFDI